MTYTKPELVTLGKAIELVQQHEKIQPFVTELKTANPAYDLDE